MRIIVLILALSGCATAAPRPLPVTVPHASEPVVAAETAAPPAAPVAPAALVPQSIHGAFIRRLSAWPGYAHFIVSDSSGVLSINDAATGIVRASLRPEPRLTAIFTTNDDGTVFVISDGTTRHLWSTTDDRVREIGPVFVRDTIELVELNAAGDRLLRASEGETEAEIRVEDRETGALIATRTVPGVMRVAWSGTGRTVLVYANLVEGELPHTLLLDPDSLATRRDLGAESNDWHPMRGTERVLFVTGTSHVLRSSTDGAVVETVARTSTTTDEFVASGDGRCFALRNVESGVVKLYDTERFHLVLAASIERTSSLAVKDACAGVFAAGPDGAITEHVPDGPPEGARFALLEPAAHHAGIPPHIALLGNDSVLVSSDRTRARFDRDRPAATFLVTSPSADRERSIWSFGFLASGGVFASGRGFNDLFRASGFAQSPCSPINATAAPRTGPRVMLITGNMLCDVESGETVVIPAMASIDGSRFISHVQANGGVSIVDLEQRATVEIPRARRLGTLRDVSRDGTSAVFSSPRGASIVDVATGTERVRFALRRGERTFSLTDTSLATWSDATLTIYGLDGTVRHEHDISGASFIPDSAALPFGILPGETQSEVIDLETGAMVATVEAVPGEWMANTHQGMPVAPVVLESSSGSVWLVARDGALRTHPLGTGHPLGTSSDLQRIALCTEGRLAVLESTGESKAYGDCLTNDRVVVHDRANALLYLRGTRLTLRTETESITFSVQHRREAPIWFAASSDGRFAAPESALTQAMMRSAGPITTAPMLPLDRASQSLDVLARLSTLAW